MHKYYKQFSEEERLEMAKSILDEHIVKTVAETSKEIISLSQEMGVSAEDLAVHRSRKVREMFGIGRESI